MPAKHSHTLTAQLSHASTYSFRCGQSKYLRLKSLQPYGVVLSHQLMCGCHMTSEPIKLIDSLIDRSAPEIRTPRYLIKTLCFIPVQYVRTLSLKSGHLSNQDTPTYILPKSGHLSNRDTCFNQDTTYLPPKSGHLLNQDNPTSIYPPLKSGHQVLQ